MKTVVYPGHVTDPPEKLDEDLDHLTRIPGVDSLLNTECAPAARAAKLPRHGWTITHKAGKGDRFGMGECALLTKDEVWEVSEEHWFKLTDGGGKGRLAIPLYAVGEALTWKPSGHVVVYTGCHLPAHLETIWRLIPLPARSKARLLMKRSDVVGLYVKALVEWRNRTMQLAAKVHADDIVVVADWNIDDNAAWFHEVLKVVWPGFRVRATKDPDLGRRTVGWVLTTMDKTAARVAPTAGSDHDAGVYTLRHVNAVPTNPHPTKPKPTPKPPDPFEKVTYNGALMDQKTKVFVQKMEKRLGYVLTILQGCYNAGGVSASAGTHDGGGVVDLAPFDFANKVHVARALGGFYWHRLPIPGVWGEHIHGGIRNHGRLSGSAAAQQVDYDGHPPRDGLAGHRIDPTFHPDPPVGFGYADAWREINPS